ncbi:DciA family protein [Streptomyces sp.]|uniref:DciA family protein n=1 Tax=Streptomyces sp. TaxID=1931 RepID=UPI002F3E9FF0
MPDDPQPAGADLARMMLNLARAEARKRGTTPAKRTPASRGRRRATFGAGRDPQSLGNVIDQLAETFGWRRPSAGAQIVIRWAELAPDAARLGSPERYDPDTRTLYLRPVSTTAATQLRLTARQVAAMLNARTGTETVATVKVLPPGSPTHMHTGAAEPTDRPVAAPRMPGDLPLRTRADASPGLIAAHELLASLKEQRSQGDESGQVQPYVPVLREPEEHFADGVAFQEDLVERARRAADIEERARAFARAEKAGRAPAVPRVFGRTA